MKKILLIYAVLILTGCAMQWTRPGTTQAEFNQDTYQCQQEAAQSFPAAIVSSTSAGYRTPSQTTCNSYGNTTNCTTQPGVQYVQPTTYTSDANAGNRVQAHRACMYARGYSLQAAGTSHPGDAPRRTVNLQCYTTCVTTMTPSSCKSTCAEE